MSLLKPVSTLICLLWFFNTAFGIWPLPMEMELGSTALRLMPFFEVVYKYEQPTGILQNLQYYLLYVLKELLNSSARLMGSQQAKLV